MSRGNSSSTTFALHQTLFATPIPFLSANMSQQHQHMHIKPNVSYPAVLWNPSPPATVPRGSLTKEETGLVSQKPSPQKKQDENPISQKSSYVATNPAEPRKYSELQLSQLRIAACVLEFLPENVISLIFEYVDQFDLVNLSTVCKSFYLMATAKLYRKLTVILAAQFPRRYNDNSRQFIRENGAHFMDTTLILKPHNLSSLISTLSANARLLGLLRSFIFDKCTQNIDYHTSIGEFQDLLMGLFDTNDARLHFLHITFNDFGTGADKMALFTRNKNVRSHMSKLFVTDLKDLYEPGPPAALSSLYLMLNEVEMLETDAETEDWSPLVLRPIDTSLVQFSCLNYLKNLTCSSVNQLGLLVLDAFKLHGKEKLKLNSLSISHCHREMESLEDEFADVWEESAEDNDFYDGVTNFFEDSIKQLDFTVLEDKVDLSCLKSLTLKVDCIEDRTCQCDCFSRFFEDFKEYAEQHEGLPNLANLEVQLFHCAEWLRPNELLQQKLIPLTEFIHSLCNLERLSVDLSIPGFKMFANSGSLTSSAINRLNGWLLEAFLISFAGLSEGNTRSLRTLQLPDFLTSFLYYKQDFFTSLLHTCRCKGCSKVLEELKQKFHPFVDIEDDEDEEEEEDHNELSDSLYILVGFILGKLQADREVCVPVNQTHFTYTHYPIFKGSPHLLHKHFHINDGKVVDTCDCCIEKDPAGKDPLNIDNLVTTYIIHQLRPIMEFVVHYVGNLDTIMLHGIYFERREDQMVPIFEEDEYPPGFVDTETEIQGSFGVFTGEKRHIPS